MLYLISEAISPDSCFFNLSAVPISDPLLKCKFLHVKNMVKMCSIPAERTRNASCEKCRWANETDNDILIARNKKCEETFFENKPHKNGVCLRG